MMKHLQIPLWKKIRLLVSWKMCYLIVKKSCAYFGYTYLFEEFVQNMRIDAMNSTEKL